MNIKNLDIKVRLGIIYLVELMGLVEVLGVNTDILSNITHGIQLIIRLESFRSVSCLKKRALNRRSV